MENKNTKIRQIHFDIDEEKFYKIHYVSEYYGRLLKGQLSYMINSYISKFEKNIGPIDMDFYSEKFK